MGLVMCVVQHHEKILIDSYMVGKKLAVSFYFKFHTTCPLHETGPPFNRARGRGSNSPVPCMCTLNNALLYFVQMII
jgi:hypothetical protein